KRIEAKRMREYTGGKTTFDTAHPEVPLLDDVDWLPRIAWLAYLARFSPTVHASALAQEWARIDQYQDYCDRSSSAQPGKPKPGAAAIADRIRFLRSMFGRLRDAVRPQLEALYRDHPEVVALGFARATFFQEATAGVQFIGGSDTPPAAFAELSRA